MKNQKHKQQEEITRKEAIKKIGDYGKWTALASLGTFILLDPQKSQANSVGGEVPSEQGLNF